MNAAPALIALPGTLLDERSLAPLLQRLARNTRVVLLGDADTLDAEVERLAALAPGPALWLGHSLGGIVALELLRQRPQAVAGLVIVAANARAGREAGAARRAAQWAEAQAHGLRALARAELAPGYAHPAADAPSREAESERLADQAEAVGMARFERQLRYAASRPGLLDPPHPIRVPLLVLSGAHDRLCPPAQGDEILALATAGAPACHATHPEAGHLLPSQNADWAAGEVARFMATCLPLPAGSTHRGPHATEPNP